MIFLYVLIIVYFAAVNFYSFNLIKSQRQSEESNANRQTNQKLFIAGLLGGALTVYVCMFVFKYKTDNILLMILMPVLAVVNIYLCVVAFKSGFSFLVV